MLASLLLSVALAPKPNIVLIVADDLGWGEVGFNGQTKIKTPHLDRMAREGLRFRQFYSGAPVCAPARSTLMTGQHTGHTYIRDNKEVQPEGQEPLPASVLTLPEHLKKAGYVTGMFGKWGLGSPGSEGDPMNQGWDEFFGYNCQRQAHNFYPTHLWHNRKKVILEGNVPGNVVGKHYSHDLIMDAAHSFVKRNASKPFFLFVPSTIPHMAMQVPDDSIRPYLGKFPESPYNKEEGYQPHPTPHAAYAGMVSRLDREVGRLRALLKSLEIDKNTLVFFTSDNGPTHGRVGGADSSFFDSAGPFKGLKGSVYEGGIRVPTVAVWPGRTPAGKESLAQGALYDLFTTFSEMAGLPVPSGLDGVSLLPSLQGERMLPRPFLYWTFNGYGGQQAVRAGDWKLLRRNLRQGNRDWELYDLAGDPGETRDVASANPAVVRRLSGLAAKEHVPSKLFPLPGADER